MVSFSDSDSCFRTVFVENSVALEPMFTYLQNCRINFFLLFLSTIIHCDCIIIIALTRLKDVVNCHTLLKIEQKCLTKICEVSLMATE